MSRMVKRVVHTRTAGAWSVFKAGPDRWEMPVFGYHGVNEALVFERVSVYGRRTEVFWAMPVRGETARTLDLAVKRTVAHLRLAQAVVCAFHALKNAFIAGAS